MQAPLALSRHKPSPPLSVPRRFGRYRLTRLLAVGGMAQIYLAKSFGAEGFVKPLVIKRLDPKLANKPQLTSLFINEAKLLVSLNHGNIVPVFDFGRVDEDLYMAMEYVRGTSVRELLATLKEDDKKLDHQLAAHVASEICKGLDYAHRKTDAQGRPAGIIHRDIKPTNILLSLEGEVKIVDFGVAKLAGRVEEEGRLTGTLAYMSPEQAERQAVDPRTDVFSTGLVLHEMLAGERAYTSQRALEVLILARKAKVPPLPEGVPAELQEVVRRATNRDPEQRYASAHEMEQALGEYLLLARSAGSTVDSVPSASKLAELLRGLPLDPADETEEASDDDDPVPEIPLDEQIELVSALEQEIADEPPDLELIQDAAETFHSEFMTRVLQEDETDVGGRRPLFLWGAAIVASIAAAVALAFLLWPSPDPPARPTPVITITPDLRPAAAAPASDGPRRVIEAPPGPDGGRRRIRRRRYGYLHLNSIPWSRVTIDGRRLKRPTPVVRLKLRAGLHRVVLENREQKLRKKLRVRIRPGATTRKLIRLR